MPTFIVNRNATENISGSDYAHEVHQVNGEPYGALAGLQQYQPGILSQPCLPLKENWIPLGEHDSCETAIEKANLLLTGLSEYKADGCYYCATDCHNK